MVSRKIQEVREMLADDKDLLNAESGLVGFLPENKGDVDDEFIGLLAELEDIIIEAAYLLGYRDGVADQTEKDVKNSVLTWLPMDKLLIILNKYGVKGKAS